MSPRTHQQNQALRDETRARIITAALRLFSAQGYERTTIRMIAEAAGIAQGLMYSHFAGKDDLLRAIFAQSIADVNESFALAAGDKSRPPEVEGLIRAAFAIIERKRDFWRLSYGVRMQPAVLDTLGPELLSWVDTIRATLQHAFESTGVAHPAIEAAILFATIDGIAQHYVLDPAGYPLAAVTEALAARYRPQQ